MNFTHPNYFNLTYTEQILASVFVLDSMLVVKNANRAEVVKNQFSQMLGEDLS